MTETNKDSYNSGDVCIHESQGILESPTGKAKLALVNMNVACYLLKRKGEVVSRNTLFDAIWPNQDISDDTLTRAISDIRAALAKISSHTHIQTLPKRGYRWNVLTGVDKYINEPPTESQSDTIRPDSSQHTIASDRAYPNKLRSALLSAVIITLVVVSGMSFIVWGMTQLSSGPLTRVAILPVDVDDESLTMLAYEYRTRLSAELMRTRQVSVLSNAAIRPQLETPFPHYNREYGIHRILETQMRRKQDTLYINCQYIDARSATVLGSIDRTVPLRNKHQLFDIKSIVYELVTRHKEVFLQN